MTEADIIARIAAVTPRGAERLGIGDDGAILADGLVVTTDSMVEGIHWDARLDPADVGWKLVAVNISDLGAMGARPAWATLALALPRRADGTADGRWLDAFAAGLGEACRHWSLPIVGGDTTASPGPRVLTLTAGGHAPRPVLRSGGRAGDCLAVTGALGRAAEAFFSSAPSPEAVSWFRRPEPPLALALALAESGHLHAMMDLSDGLGIDVAHLAIASGCGADITSAAVPGGGSLPDRLAFGEDYELLLAFPPEVLDAVGCLAAMHGKPLHVIGALTDDPAIRLDGRPEWPAPRFTHFPST